MHEHDSENTRPKKNDYQEKKKKKKRKKDFIEPISWAKFSSSFSGRSNWPAGPVHVDTQGAIGSPHGGQPGPREQKTG
jgi:hypothetical protein